MDSISTNTLTTTPASLDATTVSLTVADRAQGLLDFVVDWDANSSIDEFTFAQVLERSTDSSHNIQFSWTVQRLCAQVYFEESGAYSNSLFKATTVEQERGWYTWNVPNSFSQASLVTIGVDCCTISYSFFD